MVCGAVVLRLYETGGDSIIIITLIGTSSCKKATSISVVDIGVRKIISIILRIEF